MGNGLDTEMEGTRGRKQRADKSRRFMTDIEPGTNMTTTETTTMTTTQRIEITTKGTAQSIEDNGNNETKDART